MTGTHVLMCDTVCKIFAGEYFEVVRVRTIDAYPESDCQLWQW